MHFLLVIVVLSDMLRVCDNHVENQTSISFFILLESHAVVMSVTDDDDLIQMGTTVSSSKANYAVLELLGKGGFGAVYRVCCQHDDKKCFAMKVEKKLESREHSKLRMEIAILKLVCGEREHSHFTEIIDRGKKETFFFLVMELVGKSLADLKVLQSGKVFTPSTAFGVAIQCLEAVQDIHKHGFIHRDLKPANYACGLNQRRRIGTVRFASLACHRNQELGFKDDCESWFYLLLDILVPEGLPWKKYVDRHDVLRCKDECRKDKRSMLFQKNPAMKELSELLDYIDSLKYHNTSINYHFMYEILKTSALICGGDVKNLYDWEIPLMEDLEPFNCYICSQPYDHLLHKPVKGICGHTICEQCRKSVVVQSNSKCPFCKLDLAFLDKVGNWQLVDELNELVSNKTALLQDIRNVRRDYVSCERVIQDLAKSLKDTRARQTEQIRT
ncbi:unnamed protein product [Auanema sp. JU1783]|nr:unnamed protein product [Auanema sp. JU1783]